MNSFIGWFGGKNYLKKEITKRFPQGFNRYIEVFGGAAWVLFYKNSHADMEVYNDYYSELVNLFRCVKYHCGELQKELQYPNRTQRYLPIKIPELENQNVQDRLMKQAYCLIQ